MEKYQTEINRRKIVVEKLAEIWFRSGAAMKRKSIRYRDTRNGEESVRVEEEFLRMFKKVT